MAEARMLLLILGIGAVVSGVTILIARLSRGRRLPKYIPALLAFCLAGYCLIRALGPANGWEDLVYIVLMMIVAGVAVIALLTAIALDLIAARRARKGKRE